MDFAPYHSDLTSWTTVLTTCIVVVSSCVYLTTRRPRGFPPGPPVLPLVGSLPFLTIKVGNYFDDVLKMHKKYGDVFSVKMGKVWVWIVGDYDTLCEMSERREFSGRPFQDVYHRSKLMNHDNNFGILYGDCSDQWRRQRDVSARILHELCSGSNRLERIITSETDKLCEVMESREGAIIDICDLLDICATNVLCSLLFGERYDVTDETFRDLRRFLHYAFYTLNQNFEMEWVPILRHFRYYKNKLEQFTKVHDHLYDVIDHKLHTREVSSEAGLRDFMEGYLRALKHDTSLDDWSRQIAKDFLQAGIETITDTLGWGFYYMLKHPEIQHKVQQELDQVVGQSRGVRLSDRENLPYTEACLTEIDRLSCVSPMTTDHKALVDSKVAGYRIQKGTVVWGNLWAILRNPKVFPEPEVFRPERFIMADGSFKRHKHVLNFSIGNRSCLGEHLARQELFLIFTRVLQKFRLSVRQGYTHPPPTGTFVTTHVPPPYYVVVCRRS